MSSVRAATPVLLAGVAILASCASSGWQARRIDGTSAAAFDQSVAELQNELPRRRREDFDASLAVIWIRVTAANGGDVDGDGDVESVDARALIDSATELLADVGRGDIVAAIEKRDDDLAADYLEQLDGLGFDEVLALADLASADPYLAELQRRMVCNPVGNTIMLRGPSTPATRKCFRSRP
jgi:hypothetical protein